MTIAQWNLKASYHAPMFVSRLCVLRHHCPYNEKENNRMLQESTMKIELKIIIVHMSWRVHWRYQYSQYFWDAFYINSNKGKLSGLHVFILFLNSINVGEFLILYGNNSHNWAALYVTVSVPHRIFFSQ